MEKVSIQKYLSEKKSIMNGQKYKEILHLHENEDFTVSHKGRIIKPPSLKKEARDNLNSGLQKEKSHRTLFYEKLKDWRRRQLYAKWQKGLIKRMYGFIYSFADCHYLRPRSRVKAKEAVPLSKR